MKTEIVNFVKDLPQEVFSYNLSLDEGLYIFVDLDEEGNLISFEKGVYKKPKPKTAEKKEKPKKAKKDESSLFPQENSEEETEMNPFFKKCLARLTNSSMLTANKRYNQSFEIGSPFGIGFKKDILLESIDAKTGKTKGYPETVINEKIKGYFEVAETFIDKDNQEHQDWFNSFSNFCKQNLIKFSKEMLEKNKAKAIFIFLNKPTENDFESAYQKYLSERGVFNKPKSAIKFNDKKYQVSDTLNVFSKEKMFLEHKTAPFELNMLIDSSDAVDIWKFFELVGRRNEDGNKVLPNPCPIFIDKKELNGKVISILKENGKTTYSEIIKKIFESPDTKSDLGNYYLLFFQFVSQKGFRVFDLDFVPSFQYEIKDMQIEEIFPLGGKVAKKIKNVFEFEREITSKIFDGVLVSTYEGGGITARYFFDFNDKQSKNQIKGIISYLEKNKKNFNNILTQVLKYRKAFYDYVYKSKRESIQDFVFQDIMLKGILDDLRADEYKDRNHTKECSIKEKLNIWFSLYNYFDFNNSKTNNDMINKTRVLLEQTKKVAEDDTLSLKNDEEFAFASGQLIRYLLGQSEAGDRTHALLEPFLQKTDANLFKLAIARAFDTYKHAIPFYKGNTRYAFDRIMCEVMGFEPDTTNLKDLLPFILAGYFSETIFKKII
ncbi:MAG: hypothetical protein NW226_20905 [Microscillaceae bacterium]|nr:hypothetical protein [Microscillaceae bacterium]